jgi:hypothetical protein
MMDEEATSKKRKKSRRRRRTTKSLEGGVEPQKERRKCTQR